MDKDKKRDRFLFYGSFWEALSSLSDEQKGQCLTVISEYALYGKEPSLENPIVKMFFTLVRPQIDANNQRFENGSKGGSRKKTEENPKNNQDETKEEPIPNQKITEKEPNDNQTETETEGNKKEKEKENIIISSDKSSDIIVKINEILTKYGIPKIRDLTAERKIKLKERCRSVGGFKNFLGQIETALAESSFLRGENDKGWQADFDFFLQKSSWQKVIEGKYKDKTQWKTIDAKPDSYEEFTLAVQEMKRRAAE